MRELNLLPAWYRALLSHRRAILIQAGAWALLLMALLLSGRSRAEKLRAADFTLQDRLSQVRLKKVELEKKAAFDQILAQLRRQEQALTSTGVHVEASRMLAALSAVIPADTALTGITLSVTERDEAVAATPTTAPTVVAEPTPVAGALQRRLNVTLRGVAPGELSVGNVLAGLSKTPLFRHVNLAYAKDREDKVGSLREFEVTFVIDLNPATQNEPNP